MRLVLLCLTFIFLCLLPCSNAKAEYGFGYPKQTPLYLRDINVQPVSSLEFETLPLNAARFFGTVTVTLATSTSIYTVTSTTTCTTSTAAIRVCSPSKGRKRRQNFGIHRLKFDEDDYDTDLFFDKKQLAEQITQPISTFEQDLVRNVGQTYEESLPIPFVVQPGFSVPDYAGPGRFLIAFGTATTVSTTTSTYSYILTATCKSTTGYQTCGTGYITNFGKQGE